MDSDEIFLFQAISFFLFGIDREDCGNQGTLGKEFIGPDGIIDSMIEFTNI